MANEENFRAHLSQQLKALRKGFVVSSCNAFCVLRTLRPSLLPVEPLSSAIFSVKNNFWAYRSRIPKYSVNDAAQMMFRPVRKFRTSESISDRCEDIDKWRKRVYTLTSSPHLRTKVVITTKNSFTFLGFSLFNSTSSALPPARPVHPSIVRERARGNAYRKRSGALNRIADKKGYYFESPHALDMRKTHAVNLMDAVGIRWETSLGSVLWTGLSDDCLIGFDGNDRRRERMVEKEKEMMMWLESIILRNLYDLIGTFHVTDEGYSSLE
ncbi:hypothetical protein BT69DRAFT_1306217 [Atractiella rhizophila]|nr:hypothetical protein BT69DRAFT_1306217 [Atractiella rhizophila]